MLVRKDFSKPYTKGNIRILSEKDFGAIFGNIFGTGSEYQKSKNIKPGSVKNRISL